ncbi:hypothetical protein BDV11DRAFT_211089 [Aspergillus similis]
MGVFSCYCAICSGSLNRFDLGSSNPDALKRRRARVARRVFWRNKGLGHYYETDDEGKDGDIREERLRCMQAADEHLEPASEAGNSNDDGEEGNSSDEEAVEEPYSYDPDLLREEDFEWLQIIGGLGVYNGHPKGPSYRIHSCFQLLCRAINAGPSIKELDKRVLFNLPYGDIHGTDQDWVCIPGEEYTVKDPLAGSAFQPSVVSKHCLLEDKDNSASGKSSQLTAKILTDPFSTLPAEFMSMILSYLSGPSLFALLQASMAVRAQTQSQDTQSIDFRKAYLYFDEKTKPRYGMNDRDWLALANRRRIWGACEVLAEMYKTQKELAEGKM